MEFIITAFTVTGHVDVLRPVSHGRCDVSTSNKGRKTHAEAMFPAAQSSIHQHHGRCKRRTQLH